MPDAVAFMSYAMLSSFTPGPNNIMAMSNASRFGYRATRQFRLGVFLGFFVVNSFTIAFTVGLYRVLPTVKPYAAAIGAAYVLWLAYKTVRAGSHDTKQTGQNTFLAGAALQLLNVKAIFFGLTVASNFVVPYYHATVVYAAFALLLAGLSLAATASWAAFGSVFERFLSKHSQTVAWVMGAGLVYCAAVILLEAR